MPPLTAGEAAKLAAAFLGDLLETLRGLVNAGVELAVPPGDGPLLPEELRRGVRILDQGAGDLGSRLARVTGRRFARGARTVTVIGGDHPNLPPPMLSRCIAAARSGAVGWIPTRDGGFAAMSLPRPLPGLLRAVPWSTGAVARAVRDRARRERVVLRAAGLWYDVDSPEDLHRLARDLEAARACPRTRGALAGLDPPLALRPRGAGRSEGR